MRSLAASTIQSTRFRHAQEVHGTCRGPIGFARSARRSAPRPRSFQTTASCGSARSLATQSACTRWFASALPAPTGRKIAAPLGPSSGMQPVPPSRRRVRLASTKRPTPRKRPTPIAACALRAAPWDSIRAPRPFFPSCAARARLHARGAAHAPWVASRENSRALRTAGRATPPTTRSAGPRAQNALRIPTRLANATGRLRLSAGIVERPPRCVIMYVCVRACNFLEH